MKIFRLFIIALTLVCFKAQLTGQTHRPTGLRNNNAEVYAFTNATIIAGPDKTIDSGILLIRNGIIEAIGQNINIPTDAHTIDLQDKYIYPGFIELYSSVGLPDAKEIAKAQSSVPHNSRHWNAQVRSTYSSSLSYSYNEKVAAEMRQQGFVAAHTIPQVGVFAGSGSLIRLSELIPSKQLLLADFSQSLSFQRNNELERGYPTSAMGAISLIRQTFYDAQWYMQIKEKGELHLHEINPAISSIGRAMQNGTPFIIACEDEQWIKRAADIAKEFSLNTWIKGSGYEYRRLEDIKNYNLNLVIPLNFPEKPEANRPEKSLNLSLEELRHWYQAADNPAILNQAGINFAITSYGVKNPEKFWSDIRIAVERGLPEAKALEALTLTPARMLGTEAFQGSLEVGKLADFLIADGNLFKDKSTIEQVWIAGKKHNKTPEALSLKGKWEINNGMLEGHIIDFKHHKKLQGELLNPSEESIAKLENIKFNTGRISFSAAMEPGQVIRLSASFNETQLTGIGEYLKGEIFSWTAKKLESTDQKQMITEKDTEPDQRLNLPRLFPSMEYGIKETPSQPSYVLIRNATVWTQGPEGILENADMLVAGGKIQEIGNDLSTPAGAVIIDATGKHLTPGIIDPHLHTSISGGVNETGDAITSETRIADVIDADNVWMYRLLAGGLTTANLFHGSANPIGGQSAVIKMRWGANPDQLFMQDSKPGLKFALGENVKRMPERYPNTRMGAEQIIKDTFLAALEYEKQKKDAQGRRRRDAKPFRKDLQLEPIVEVINGERLAHVHAYRQDEMLMMMRLAEEFGFTIASFEHTVEGYKIADELREHGAAAIVWTDWSSFKVEAYDAIHQNARLLMDAGVLTSLHSDNTQLATRMNWEAGKILRSGVSEEEAMNLITLYPAQILQIDHRAGTLQPGKDADFVIWNGHPLSSFTTADQTWIEGRKYFDKEQDKLLQQEIKEERQLILQQVLQNK